MSTACPDSQSIWKDPRLKFRINKHYKVKFLLALPFYSLNFTILFLKPHHFIQETLQNILLNVPLQPWIQWSYLHNPQYKWWLFPSTTHQIPNSAIIFFWNWFHKLSDSLSKIPWAMFWKGSHWLDIRRKTQFVWFLVVSLHQ